MKVSKFNFFYPYVYDNNQFIAYNSLAGTLALIDKENYNSYLDFEKNNVSITDKDLEKQLKEGFFLIEDNVDELTIIRHNMYASRFNTDNLSLAILPTSDCNFKCVYCFEKDIMNATYMDEKTINSVIDYVKEKSKTIKSLDVYWYGGEPLIAMDIIETLSKKFIEICEKENIDYNSDMISNGYNLTRKNIEILKSCRISTIQITVDGGKQTHDKRRILKNNDGTYERIVNNLVNLKKDDNIMISLRINVDKENINNCESILKFINDNNLHNFVVPYLSRVFNTDGSFSDNDKLLSYEEFMEYNDLFARQMIEYGYDKNIKKYALPTQKRNYCSCDSYSSIVINANGYICKCWMNCGQDEHCMGNINNKGSIKAIKSYLDRIMFDPTLDDECSVCKYMPFCMGGCPNARKADKEDVCKETKYRLEEKLAYVANEINNSLSTSC